MPISHVTCPWAFRSVFNVFIAAIPDAPNAVSPEDDIFEREPTYSWDAVDGADEYQVDVDGPSDSGFTRWFDADDVCSGNVCEVDPDERLRYGDHTWRVRARNEGGTGNWSQELDFEVNRDELDEPDLTRPSGTIGDNTPRFEWEPVAGADEYQIQVRDRNNNDDVVFIEEYNEDAICDRDECGMTSSRLSNGRYRWRVRAHNERGYGDWSDFMSFRIN